MKNIFLITIIILFYSIEFQPQSRGDQLRLSLQAGLQIPTGDFTNTAGTGWGLTATFEYWQETPLAFTGSIGYHMWGAADELPKDWDYKITSIPIQLGIRYYLARGDFHPYLGAELGLYLLSSELTRKEGNTKIITEESESKFGLAPMFGFRYHLGGDTDLDINMKYHIISTEGSSTTIFGFNAGVQLGL